MWGFNSLEMLVQDCRNGLRMLRRSPGFTAAAVLSLALGIGANTAIFSVIDALMLRLLPVHSPGELVLLNRVSRSGRGSNFGMRYWDRFRDLDQVFSSAVAIADIDRSNVTIDRAGGSNDRQVRVGIVTGNYFSALGVKALRGRTFTEDDDGAPGERPVTVISYAYWEGTFLLAPDVVGRTLALNGTTYDIVGVTPRNFSGDWVGRPTDLWIPVAMLTQVMPELPPGQPRGGPMSYRVMARLQPGITIPQAQAAAEVVFEQVVRESAGPSPTPQQAQQIAEQHLEVESAARGYSPQRESFAEVLVILMVAAGAVLLIACANLANLLLARSAVRQREMAVRQSLGASRGRIARQLLTESVLLAVMGGALGLALAAWGTSALSKLLHSTPVTFGSALSFDLDVQPEGRVLAFTTALCLLTGILFGIAPALRGARVSLVPLLGGRGADAGSPGRTFGLRKMLVITQVALSLVLLVGTGLLVRTLRNLESEDLGFDREHVLLVWTAPGQTGRQGAQLATLFGTVQERISSLPGVVSASPSVSGLLKGGPGGGPPVTVEGYTPKPNEEARAEFDIIGPGFFDTVGQRLLEGRDFTLRDTETAPRVVIVNEQLARYFFGSESAMGRRLKLPGNAPGLEIVGVVTDVKRNSPRDKDRMMFYYPYGQQVGLRLMQLCLAVRAAGSPASIAAKVRQELREIDSRLPVLKIHTVEEQLDESLIQERLIATLSGFFGALAVLLACLGLYGVMSYLASRRTNEIGIRMALGATRAGILLMILKESMWLVSIGVVVGVPATLAITRLLSAKLFGISASDPLTVVAAIGMMIAVAALAAFHPALRASSVDPVIALRYE